jgi:hypothetical protein
MRALLAVAGLLAAASLAPADAAEIFKRGPVTCTALSPAVTAMTLGKCKWRLDVKRRALQGNCKVTLTVDGEEVTFTATGEMARLADDLPENDAPLEATYPQVLSCTVDSKRVLAVYNCKTEIEGLRKECDVCVKLLGTHCYAASGAVTVDGALPSILTHGARAAGAGD